MKDTSKSGTQGRLENARRAIALMIIFSALICWVNGQSFQKDYIYIGNRLIAVDSNRPPVIPASGIVSWWTGDATADDVIGSSNGILVNGTSIGQGKVSGALSFDGTDDYVELPTMNLGNTFSVEFWMYPTSTYAPQNLVSNSASGGNYGELLLVGNGTSLSYWLGGEKARTPSGSIEQNKWSHVGLTHDGYKTRLYINGVLQGTSDPYLMTFNNPLRLGATFDNSLSKFKGLLDEVSLYDRALSDVELLAIVGAGSSGKAKNQFNIATTFLPTMFVGNPVSSQIRTLYGTAPITFSLLSGTLPPGLTLSTDGSISGIPTTAGEDYAFTVQAVDGTNWTAIREISAKVETSLIPPAGLVHWWPGEGAATDILGGNDGSFQGGALYHSVGEVGSAFRFDGAANYVEIPTMNLGNTFSVEFWMYPISTSSLQNLVSNSASGGNYGELRLVGNGTSLSYWQGGSQRASTPSGSIQQNTWSHIGLTHDGYKTRLYINGVLQGTSDPYLMTFNNRLRLGLTFDNSVYKYKGLLDEVSLYDRALSIDDMQAIFAAGVVGKMKLEFNITTQRLPDLFVGSAISYQINTVFGVNPITFSLISGVLPSGMTLDSNGIISGTPTTEGYYTFTLQAVDNNAQLASRVITASVYTALAPPAGLVHWWPGDANPTDIVGTSNGTFQNGNGYSSVGKVAAAFGFDGANNYVSIPTINLGTSFTLEFWMYPTRSGVREHLVSNSASSSNYGALSFLTDHLEYQQGGNPRQSTPSGSISRNTWSHIALTYDGSVSQLYVNGVLLSTSAAYTMSFNNALRLGFSVNGTDYHFLGLLDEVSIYGRVLSGDEILEIFSADSKGKAKS